MKKLLVYDSPVVELHQRLFNLLVEVEEAYQKGRAYYEFVQRNRQPVLEVKLYVIQGKPRLFRVPLPTTEADLDQVSRQITKLLEAIGIAAEREQAAERRRLLNSLSPEQQALLNLNQGTLKHEG